MTEKEWRPFYARLSEDGASSFVRLNEGVSEWLRESLWEWLSARMKQYVREQSSFRGTTGRHTPVVEKIRRAERVARISTGWTGAGGYHDDRVAGLSALRKALYENDNAFLTVVDLELSELEPAGEPCKRLEYILEETASAWRVGTVAGRPGLVARIDKTVQLAAESTEALDARAGRLLADAWKHAFSMHRDPSSAYRYAVRAVEAAAGPVLSPKDSLPTLGKMISALRSKPEKWNFSFTVDSAVEPKMVLLSMLQMLWTNEYTRHVDPDVNAPLHVSQREAESAVVLALTLVNWFASGAISEV
ncbi:hypothetical protein ACH4LS_30405 [Streptomyces luteogriseus]|uniref:hypothetical protein n=1 Tax=Streptomyces luteogriseus TaxID=68233 RepID=UPI0037A94A38